MKRSRYFLIAFLVLCLARQPSHAYGEPSVLGQGRYLTLPERTAFFQHVQHTGLESERKKFAKAFERLMSSAESKPVKIEILDVTRFKFKSVLNDGAMPGNQILLICFNCEEGIPPRKLAERKKTNSRFYDIWVLSAAFMIVEQNPKTGTWRVLLENGGAE